MDGYAGACGTVAVHDHVRLGVLVEVDRGPFVDLPVARGVELEEVGRAVTVGVDRPQVGLPVAIGVGGDELDPLVATGLHRLAHVLPSG